MNQPTNRFERAAKIILYSIITLLPVWFIPLPVGVDFGRELTFGILVIVGVLLWLISILTQGEIRYQHSPILYAGGFLFLIMGLCTIFSKSPYVSALIANPTAERFSTIVMGLLLMMLAGSVFVSMAEVGTALFLFLGTSSLAGIITLIQLATGISPYHYLFSAIQGADFNVVGTLNGASLSYAALLLIVLGFFISSFSGSWKRWVRWVLVISMAIFLGNLLLINFKTAWIIVAGGSIVLFGLMLRQARASRSDTGDFVSTNSNICTGTARFGSKQ